MTNTYAVFRLKSRKLPPLSLLVALVVGKDCYLMSSLLGDAVQVFRSPKEQLVTSDRGRRIKSLIKVVGGNRFIGSLHDSEPPCFLLCPPNRYDRPLRLAMNKDSRCH